VDKELADIIKRFLKYSFKDIEYSWENLTERERTFCTEAEFQRLKEWVLQ
jgi:hypothetical protein